MTPEEKFAAFEKMGPQAVRYNLATLEWQGTEANLANAWLALRAESDASEARKTAKTANLIAVISIVISVVTAIAVATITCSHGK